MHTTSSARLFATLFVLLACGSTLLADESDDHSPRRLAISRNRQLIAVAANDKQIRVWDANRGALLHTLALSRPVISVAFANDNSTLLAGTLGTRENASQPTRSTVYGWRVTPGAVTLQWKLPIVGSGLGIVVSPTEDWFAVTTTYAWVGFGDVRTGELRRIWAEAGNSPGDIGLTRDGKTLITAGQHLILWNVGAEPLPKQKMSMEGHQPEPRQCERFHRARLAVANSTAVSPDGQWAVAMGAFERSDGRPNALARIDIATGTAKVLMQDLEDVRCLAISPDGKLIALGLDSGRVTLWSEQDQKIMAEIPASEMGSIRSMAFLDNEQVVVASKNGTGVGVLSTSTRKLVRRLWPLPNK